MNPISNLTPHLISVPAIPTVEREVSSKAAGKPDRDEYIPEKKPEPSGRYWLERDEEGVPRVRFDSPEIPEGTPKTESPEKKDSKEESPKVGDPSGKGRKAEKYTVNTDKVDREIEKLKKEKEELESQINRETDEARKRELERKLSRVEDELRQKDNDAYRRQHAEVTKG